MILIYTDEVITSLSRRLALLALLGLGGLSAAGCKSVSPPTTGVVRVVAAEAQWGSLIAAVGGSHVHVTDLIDNPTIDPHTYEPTPADADAVAHANLVVVNGLGYDTWATQLAAAAGARVLDIGQLLGRHRGDNPHLWYDLYAIDQKVLPAMAGALNEARPSLEASGVFDQGAMETQSGLRPLWTLQSEIAIHYFGTEVAASESIAQPLCASTSLHLVTPARFLRAISEGDEPTAEDLSTIDQQLRSGRVGAYLLNTQNEPPVVLAQVALAHELHIPVVAMTETPPAHMAYATWQTNQLQALFSALQQSRGSRT